MEQMTVVAGDDRLLTLMHGGSFESRPADRPDVTLHSLSLPSRNRNLMGVARKALLNRERVRVIGIAACPDPQMTLFAAAFQMPSRMYKDRVDMAYWNQSGVGNGRRPWSGQCRHSYEPVVRSEMASHPGASAPFEAHSLMFTGLDGRRRVTQDASKAARQLWMMRFDQKLMLVMIELPPKKMP
jgi:hypothetical protein